MIEFIEHTSDSSMTWFPIDPPLPAIFTKFKTTIDQS
jgi:hypothetical protein